MLQPPVDSPRRPLSIMTTATNTSSSGKAWMTGVDADNAWENLILTLDGGGIRGYASLLILQQLMHEVAECERRLQETHGPVPGSKRITFKEDELLPCHYFDFMYGTSTGGLIGVMLGRLRMTVPQCLEIYREVGNDLFGHRRNVLPLATKYHHKPLEKAVKKIVQGYCKHHTECNGNDWHPWTVPEDASAASSSTVPSTTNSSSSSLGGATTPRICQSVCLTATHTGQIDEAYLLRSYDHRYDPRISPDWVIPYNEGLDKAQIWQVTRATSAAPFFFKMLEADFGKGKTGFKDGGIRENNPSHAAYTEHISLHGEDHEPALLLSIGTGRPDVATHDGFASVWPGPFGKVPLMKKWAEKFAVFKNVLIKYTEGENQHKVMRTIAKGEHRWYKRLNVDKGLEGMKLDNWEKGPWTNPAGVTKEVSGGKTLTRMEQATNAYLTRGIDRSDRTNPEYAAPKDVLKQVAEKLVRHRRMREEHKHDDIERWQTHMGQWLTGTLREEDAMVLEKAQPQSRRGSKQPILTGESSTIQPPPVAGSSSNTTTKR